MSIPQEIISAFQTKAMSALSALVDEFNLELTQKDEMTFSLVGSAVDIHLYIYPGHVPSVNVTLMPRGVQWGKWRQESRWGKTGIWLDHLAVFRNAKDACIDTHFQTAQELASHVDTLIRSLRSVGSDLLQGDATVLLPLSVYVDGLGQSKLK